LAARIVLRRGVELTDPLDVALGLLEAWAGAETYDLSRPESFDESDLRAANTGGARISAAEKAAILERREEIEAALHEIGPDATLTAHPGAIPWEPMTRLFAAFADIRGVGLSKTTKALHKKRPALIPMLDSVVQGYLAADAVSGSLGEQAIALVRGYKHELNLNRQALAEVRRTLAVRGCEVTEVRLFDLFIWAAFG